MNEKISAEDSTLDPDTWVDRYGDYLYRFAVARVKDAAIVEDLVQETFLAALRGRKNFRSRSAIQTWLTAILKHKIVDHYRKKNREQAVEDIETVSEAVDSFFNNAASWKIRPEKWDINPMKIYEQQEFMDILYRCLAELPPRLAKVFMMREIDELETDEICKTLNISATNSWVMLYRARTYLRRCLEIKWFDNTTIEST